MGNIGLGCWVSVSILSIGKGGLEMNDWKDIINFTNGTVDFGNIESCSFELIEKLYEQIKQPLQERRKKGIPEASTHTTRRTK